MCSSQVILNPSLPPGTGIWLWRTSRQSCTFIPSDPKSPPAPGSVGLGLAVESNETTPRLHHRHSCGLIPGDPKYLPVLGCGTGSVFGQPRDNSFIPGDPKPLGIGDVGLDPSLENPRTIPSFQVIPNPCLHQDLAVEDTGKSHVFIPADPKSLPAMGCGAGCGFGEPWDNPFIPGDPKSLGIGDVGLDPSLESPRTIPSFQVIPNLCCAQSSGIIQALGRLQGAPGAGFGSCSLLENHLQEISRPGFTRAPTWMENRKGREFPPGALIPQESQERLRILLEIREFILSQAR
ncbi:hypothetical protein TURU_036211 [Turdus rufiventris]|nr:hypothetical protein TURU_036211 [Turdus rufiventris]